MGGLTLGTRYGSARSLLAEVYESASLCMQRLSRVDDSYDYCDLSVSVTWFMSSIIGCGKVIGIFYLTFVYRRGCLRVPTSVQPTCMWHHDYWRPITILVRRTGSCLHRLIFHLLTDTVEPETGAITRSILFRLSDLWPHFWPKMQSLMPVFYSKQEYFEFACNKR